MAFGTDLLHTREVLAPHLSPGMHVADFGVGRTGHVVVHASTLVGPDGHVHAVDIVPEVLDMVCSDCARRGIANVSRVWGDFERAGGVPIPDGSVDLVTSLNNLWSSQEPRAMFVEAKRILKPDGALLLVDWDKRSVHPAAPPQDQRAHPIDVQHWLAPMDLQETREFRASRNHWGMLIRFA